MNNKQELSNHTKIKKATGRQDRSDSAPPDDLEAPSSNPRRAFLRHLSGVAIATLTVSATSLAPLAETATAGSKPLRAAGKRRAEDCFDLRHSAAQDARQVAMPTQAANGDEQLYPNYIGNFSKGLLHNAIGEVAPDAYRALVDAANHGTPKAYEKVPLGGALKLVNPLAGVAFDLEGLDSHQLAIDPPPPVASRARADDAVESYWMALCRDVHFSDYGKNPLAQAAASELSHLAGFDGPKSRGKVTPQTLFRGFTADDVVGPYVSQFLLKPFSYGQIPISGQIITFIPGIDHTGMSHACRKPEEPEALRRIGGRNPRSADDNSRNVFGNMRRLSDWFEFTAWRSTNNYRSPARRRVPSRCIFSSVRFVQRSTKLRAWRLANPGRLSRPN